MSMLPLMPAPNLDRAERLIWMFRDYRLQTDPTRDAQLTAQFHRRLKRLKPPRRPIDGVKWNPFTHPLNWAGWPIMRVSVNLLK